MGTFHERILSCERFVTRDISWQGVICDRECVAKGTFCDRGLFTTGDDFVFRGRFVTGDVLYKQLFSFLPAFLSCQLRCWTIASRLSDKNVLVLYWCGYGSSCSKWSNGIRLDAVQLCGSMLTHWFIFLPVGMKTVCCCNQELIAECF